MSKLKWTDEAVLAEGRKYASRNEFYKGSPRAYTVACKHNLLDQLYPSQRADWSNDADVLAEGRKYASRREFQKGTMQAYRAALDRGLLDQLYPSKYADWSNDADVLAEGRKYASRKAFRDGSPGAYTVACRRNLLDQIGLPKRNGASDNDAIYIWRAVGQHYNGNPVYKIGVTSARLNTERIEQVSKAGGFEFDLICCEPVQGKASNLEAKLHILGEDPCFTGFSGCTEFRALSDSALDAAITLIINHL